jgi:hypothetical protein
LIKDIFKFLFLLALGISLLYWIFYEQEKTYAIECIFNGGTKETCSLWQKLRSDFKNLHYGYVFATIFVFLISNYIRAVRWNMLLQPLGVAAQIRNTFSAISIAYMVNLVIPRAGEIARATSLMKSEEISFEKSLGTVITDRISDVICLFIISIFTILLAYDDIIGYFRKNFNLENRISNLSLYSLAEVFVAIMMMAGMIFFVSKKFRQNKYAVKIYKLLDGISEGIKSISRLKNPILFVLLSFLMWFCYFTMTYLGFKAFEPTAALSFKVALVVFFFGSLGIVFPSPGGMGSYHFLAMESLTIYGISKADGFIYANMMFFAINIFSCIFFGTLGMLMLKKSR